MSFFKFLKEKVEWSAILIVAAVILLAAFNWQPGTFLSGWDNLHPEFNFPLNLGRSFFSSWQEYQGLGLLPGMGHAADLFRELFLWLLAFFLPTSFLRYFFHFLMLLLGPLGVYFLLKDFIFEKERLAEKRIGGLAGAFFYLFNLATLQLFYVPYEAFSLHFAALPWLFLVNLNFLARPGRKSLFWLFLVNLFSVAQGYVATFFLVYCFSLLLVFLAYWWRQKNSWRQIFLASFLVFLVNAFWLLPNLYFALTNVEVTMRAKINLMSTEENFLRNQKYGNLANVVLLKNFWFDNVEPAKGGEMELMMAEWEKHLEKSGVRAIGYLLFLLAMVGIVAAWQEKSQALLFLPVFLLGFLMLSSDIPFISLPAKLLYRSQLFFQLFRFPFTKFSALTAFSLAIFYAVGLVVVLKKKLKSRQLKKIYCGGLSLFFLLLPVIFLLPVFRGQLFYQKERVVFPPEYFAVFDFFQKQARSGRIANFPQVNFWGWSFYHWPKADYSGSGFLWYGIGQPILDRAFDPWGKANENYYWEISYALYSQNQVLFEKVLDKYQVSWVLVDESNANSGSWRALGLEGLAEFLKSPKFALAAQFGKIKVYRVGESAAESFVYWTENLPTVGPGYQWTNFDQAYFENGSYLSAGGSQPADIYYPFRTLFSGRHSDERDFEIEDRGEYFVFRQKLPAWTAGYFLRIPRFSGQELVWVDPQDLSKTRVLIPEVRYLGQELTVFVPKVDGYFSAQVELASMLKLPVAQNCTQFKKGKVDNKVVLQEGKKILRLSANDANNCGASFPFPNLSHKFGYLLAIKSRHLKGRNLLFWLENLTSEKADLELYLSQKDFPEYLIQPPMAKDGLGYALHFDNISIGQQETVNDLQAATVNPLPYDFLTGLCLTQQKLPISTAALVPMKANHPNPTLYEVDAPAEKGTIVLSQAYHPGWRAYLVKSKVKSQKSKLMDFLAPVLGKEIKEHVLVNNWENGWNLDSLKIKNLSADRQDLKLKIVLVFLPQYLQYLGFGFLGMTIIFVGIKLVRR